LQKIIEEQQRLSETLKPNTSSQEPANEASEPNSKPSQNFNGNQGQSHSKSQGGQGQHSEGCSPPPRAALTSGILLSATTGAFEAYPQSRRAGKNVEASNSEDESDQTRRPDGGIEHNNLRPPPKKMRANADSVAIQRDDKPGLPKTVSDTGLKPLENRGH
jgi:hypothetical protein